ncbi:transglutaminase domain-containing protein [Flammeovirga aprica]|uniref:Transglutaminase domain-containing protein n=1 Tax=Flammeovirga aprica JL-4 TaxID=694437 RepID=A0A7X9RZI6_9BACT|nr:transglutaminase domain-containing protein [Flammeovirga aprica]NME71672.1 transglutaminase domain-containing protein [Flammeovirga aprica JL-4]
MNCYGQKKIKTTVKYDSLRGYYFENGDSLKFKASDFLIKDITTHFAKDYYWINKKTKRKVFFDELSYEDFDQALTAFRHITDSISLRPKKIHVQDIEKVSIDYLRENIDLAFIAWKRFPWSKGYDFETFCEYILPYRSAIEPLQNWRKEYLLLYETVGSQLSKNEVEDPVYVCGILQDLLQDFTFIGNQKKSIIPLLGPMSLQLRRHGNCPDLANLMVFAGRSIGLAIAYDYTPHYAASSNRHFWNAVITNSGETIPFNGIEDKPGIYNPNNKRLGKVIRKTYSANRSSLVFKLPKSQIPNGHMQTAHYKDVTSEYVKVADFNYQFNDPVNNGIGYLSVYNLADWRPIDWADIKNTEAEFTNLGVDLVYLPFRYINRKCIYERFPILLNVEGEKKVLRADQSHKISFKMTHSMVNQDRLYEETNSLELEEGKLYRMYYWDKKWILIGENIVSNGALFIDNVPAGALYKVQPVNPDKFERIFTIGEGTHQIYWY